MSIFKIKTTITIFVLTVILVMVGGIFALKNNYYWQEKYLRLQLDYLETKIYLNEYENNSASIPNDPISIVSFRPATEIIEKYVSNRLDRNKSRSILAQQEMANSVPILLYHGIISKKDWEPDKVNIRLEDFRNQMFALKKAGYRTITIEDYLDFSKGKKRLPKKSFLLTFDDGRKDSYYPADPILRALSYTAVMNIITNRSIGRDSEKNSFHLSESELQKMIASGRWQIESHGKDDHDYQKIGLDGEKGHFLSNKLWLDPENRLETDKEYEERVRNDLLQSKRDLEKNLHINVLSFAYPFGDYGQASENFPESEDILRKTASSIYPLSMSQVGNSDFPVNIFGNSATAERIGVDSSINAEDLVKMLDNSQEKPLGYNDDLSKDNGWLHGWGTLNFKNNALVISDSETEDSGFTFLSGSHLWKDYSANAEITVSKGNQFAILARYRDGGNFIACDFSQDKIVLTQKINGKDRPDIIKNLRTGLDEKKEADIGIYADKDEAGCILNGKIIVKGEIDNNFETGGIGFKIWDTSQKGEALAIRNLKVEKIIPKKESEAEICKTEDKHLFDTLLDIKK